MLQFLQLNDSNLIILTCSSTEIVLTFQRNSINAKANAIAIPAARTINAPPTLAKVNSSFLPSTPFC